MTSTQTISFLDELHWRGLLHQVTDDAAIRRRLGLKLDELISERYPLEGINDAIASVRTTPSDAGAA